MGFDGVKFDAGGGNDNMTLWALAINATGRVRAPCPVPGKSRSLVP